jgi:hypothetical protein
MPIRISCRDILPDTQQLLDGREVATPSATILNSFCAGKMSGSGIL